MDVRTVDDFKAINQDFPTDGLPYFLTYGALRQCAFGALGAQLLGVYVSNDLKWNHHVEKKGKQETLLFKGP